MLSTFVYSLVVAVVLRLLYEYQRDRKLPPGPRRLPLIGNLHQAPPDSELTWLVYHEWSKKYGKIFSVQYGGSTLIIISDHGIARELLDKRGSTYSDRPRLVMAGENLTKGMHMLLRRYDDNYRRHQRMNAPLLSPRASQAYLALQDMESKQLLRQFLSHNDFCNEFERYSASLAYSLIYGYRVLPGDDKAMETAHRVQDNMVSVAKLGAFIVDALPVLNHLPPALAPWKRLAAEFYDIEATMHERNMAAGMSSMSWNWTKEFLNSKEGRGMDPVEMSYGLGILADAGLDTTAMTLQFFILAALAYPEFVPKAQKQLDDVVGPDRLPTIEDKKALPYIMAIVKETLRWRPLAPTAFPHATLKEDHYMGYRIPRGAIIVPLQWSMNQDEETFENPSEFRPERYVENPDLRYSAFGFGRRVCTGRHIAENSLFLIIARMLWAFDIRPAIDENGRSVPVDDMALTTGFTAKPLPFKAVFKPRSERHVKVVEKEWDAVEKDVGVILDSIHEHRTSLGM